MASNYWEANSPNDREDAGDAFELLEQSKTDQKPTLGSINNKWATTPTSRLPPRPLSPQLTTRIVRTAFWIALPVIIVIVGLSFLADSIAIFLPDTSYFQLNNPISCDLMTGQRSKLQSAFTINIRGATHLTFAQAKAVDVIWQLFVGAGGRFMMAWISYKVFMDGLTRLAEQSPISYNLYTSLTFSTTSLFAAWYSLKAVFFSKGWRIKCFLLWVGLSTLYVLGFPTLMTATAGYLTPSTAGFNMLDGTFLQPSSPNLRSCYNVFAGALIGYTNDTVAGGPPVSVLDVVNQDQSCGYHWLCANVPNLWQDYPLYASLLNGEIAGLHTSPEIALIIAFAATLNASLPVYDANETAHWTETHALEGSSMGYGSSGRDFQNFTSNITIEGRLYHFRNWEFSAGVAYEPTYCYNNKTIPSLEALSECLPESYFVWGFSSLLVYTNLSLFMVWVFGMYLIWLDARIYSALCRSGRKVRGHYRAVADLSEAMEEVLGNETCSYSDSELARELSKQPGLRYYASDPQDSDVSHIGLSSISRGRVPYNSTKVYGKVERD